MILYLFMALTLHLNYLLKLLLVLTVLIIFFVYITSFSICDELVSFELFHFAGNFAFCEVVVNEDLSLLQVELSLSYLLVCWFQVVFLK